MSEDKEYDKIEVMKADLDKALTENMQLIDRLHSAKQEVRKLYSDLEREKKHVDMLLYAVQRLSKLIEND